MTKPGENISLILYEFKLQNIDLCDRRISKSEYGSYVVKFLEDTFYCSFTTLTVMGKSKVTSCVLISFISKMYPIRIDLCFVNLLKKMSFFSL